jgi:hypothetical protein
MLTIPKQDLKSFYVKRPIENPSTSRNYDNTLAMMNQECSKIARPSLRGKIVDATEEASPCKERTLAGATQRNSKANHGLQTSGQFERSNQQIGRHLQVHGNARSNKWAGMFPSIQYVRRPWPSKSMGQIPFELLTKHATTTRIKKYSTALPETTEREGWLKLNRTRMRGAVKRASRLLRRRKEKEERGRQLQETTRRERGGSLVIPDVTSPVNYRLKSPGYRVTHEDVHTTLPTAHRKYGMNYTPLDKEGCTKGKSRTHRRHNQERERPVPKGWRKSSDWKDTTGINAATWTKGYCQGRATAMQEPKDKKRTHPIDPAASYCPAFSIPISISHASPMTDGPSQRPLGTIPVDDRTAIPYWELNSWWYQPEQPNFWPTTDDGPDEQQRRASHFPEIPINYPEIPNESGPSDPFLFEFPQLPCTNPDATAIEIPTERQASQNALLNREQICRNNRALR